MLCESRARRGCDIIPLTQAQHSSEWYSDKTFAKFRARLVSLFTLSVIFFGLSLALFAMVKLHATDVAIGGYICTAIFSLFTIMMLSAIRWMNSMFLNRILLKTK